MSHERTADFFEVLKRRRSIRDFEEKEVPPDLIAEVLNDTCLAPSSGNGQPWRFIVVHDRRLMRRLSDESKKNLVSYLEKNPGSHLKKYEAALKNQDFNVFYNAPCLVYILCPKELGSAEVDGALAAAYFMFAAAARGLGTCWVALGSNIQDPEIMGEIGMTAEARIIAPLIVGYPRNIPATPQREPRILKVIS